MVTNGNQANCGFADEIVSYIYDESGEVERRKFETHLAGCSMCTDEFAATSNARFSVFEWQKEEFAKLPTPEIVIPYAPNAVRDEAPGFFAGLGAFLTFPRFAAAAGAIVLSVGLGFLAMNYLGDAQVAHVEQVLPQVKLPETPLRTEIATADEPKKAPEDVTKAVNNVPSAPAIRPLTTSHNRRQKVDRTLTADVRKPVERSVSPKPAQLRERPVLSNFGDNDDKSLRLADLFDDGGR